MVRIVGDDEGTGSQMRLHELQDVRIKRLGAVEQNKIDLIGKIGRKRLQRIAFAQFDEIRKTALIQVLARASRLRRFELGRDETAAAIVPERGGKMQCRDAEGGTSPGPLAGKPAS